MPMWIVYPDKEPSPETVRLADQVEEDGGRVLAVYQDPVGMHWQIFCLLPLAKVEAPPFQRNLSPTHLKRLSEVIRKLDRFTDPILVVSPQAGVYWTPNGNHRRAALDRRRPEDPPRGARGGRAGGRRGQQRRGDRAGSRSGLPAPDRHRVAGLIDGCCLDDRTEGLAPAAA